MIKRIFRRLSKFRYSKVSDLSAVSKIVRSEFDSSFYEKDNLDVTGYEKSLSHYLNVGWKEGRNPADWFSTSDYLAMYPDVAASRMEPFTHYITYGRSEGRLVFPSHGSEHRAIQEFFKRTGLYFPIFPEHFDSEFYAMAAGISPENRWDALAHFLTHGVFSQRLFTIFQPQAALLYMVGNVAERHDRSLAFRYFQLAERQGSDDPSLFHHLGDCYLSYQQFDNAKRSYERSIELGGAYYWTYRNLGFVNSELGEIDNAIRNLKNALKLRPEKKQTHYELKAAASEQFHVEWVKANGLALNENDSGATLAMTAAIAQYQDNVFMRDLADIRPKRETVTAPRIAIFGSDSLPQCKLYRITQKIDQLAALNKKVDFFSLMQAKEFLHKIALYDIVICYRIPATPEVIEILSLAQKFNVCTFYDIDDLIFDESCYPPRRERLKGMVSAAEYAGLVTGRALFREAMAMCDYGIASTPPLVDAISPIVRQKTCFLSRNALGRVHYAAMDRHAIPKQAESNRVVFFYGSGSRSHNENFAIMAKALCGVLRRHVNTELRIMGPLDLGSEFGNLERQIVRVPFTANIKDYWRELSSADINLAPLTAGAFNDGKSEIKWMEAATMSIPSVVSPSAVYDDLIRHGTDGFIAHSDTEWATMLDRLVTDGRLRNAIGKAARLRVISEYDMQSGGEHLMSVLENGWQRTVVAGPRRDRTKSLVLVVNIFYPPEFIGGATRIVEQSVEDLRSSYGEDFDIEVFCGREPDGRSGALERYDWNGVPVTSLSPFIDHDVIETSIDTLSFFERYLEFLDPDIIHFHCIQRLGASLLDAAAARGIPHIVSVHDGWWISDRQFLIDDAGVPVYESNVWGDSRRLDRLRSALNRANATLAVSQTQASLYRDRGIENVKLLPNGSETLPDVEGAPLTGPVWLGLLGGLGLAKGSELLKEVLIRRRYKNLRFLIVDHMMLEGIVRHERWGDNEIELIGKASFANVAKVYSRLHGLLAVSVCIESFGLVAREARRLGRWVIASDRGGMSEDVIANQNGFIIDPTKFEDLMRVLDLMDADPDKYRSPPPDAGPLRDRSEVASDLACLYKSILNGIKQD